MKNAISQLVWSLVLVAGCPGNGGTDAAGNDSGLEVAAPDAPLLDRPVEASTDAGALLAECQALAMTFASNCAPDTTRTCLWNSYRALCALGNTRLLVDSMHCLDARICRTFSDPNEGAACLATLHPSGESTAVRSGFQRMCMACGVANCAAAEPTGEVFTYLGDADADALAGCLHPDAGTCTVDQAVLACRAVPGVALFAPCAM